MLVDVMQLRAHAIKLTEAEIADAPRHRGNLFISAGHAYLAADENPHLGQILLPLRDAVVYTVKDDVQMIRGLQARGQWSADDPLPQVWACKIVRDAGAPIMKSAYPGGPDV